jgi:hypothetical protein
MPDKKRNAVYEKRYERYKKQGLLQEQMTTEKKQATIQKQEQL